MRRTLEKDSQKSLSTIERADASLPGADLIRTSFHPQNFMRIISDPHRFLLNFKLVFVWDVFLVFVVSRPFFFSFSSTKFSNVLIVMARKRSRRIYIKLRIQNNFLSHRKCFWTPLHHGEANTLTPPQFKKLSLIFHSQTINKTHLLFSYFPFIEAPVFFVSLVEPRVPSDCGVSDRLACI